MFPRRSSTNPNPGHATPHPKSGPFSGGRSLSLGTSQRTPRATTARIVEIESPQSESPPQEPAMLPQPSVSPEMFFPDSFNQQSARPNTFEIDSPQSESSPQEPAMPPRPSISPKMSPHDSFNQQSAQPNIYETLGSPSQSQPSNIAPIPTPLPQSQLYFPPPVLHRQDAFDEGRGRFMSPSNQPAPGEGAGGFISPPQRLAPGGGVGGFISPPQDSPGEVAGGFTAPFSPRVGSGRDHYRRYTADGTHWFNAMPPPPSDSGSHHYKPADVSGGIHADVWPTYNEISEKFDRKRLSKWNDDLDVLLIFAALFSAIVTAFLITALSGLGPNYQQQSALLLYQLLNGRDPALASISDPTAPFEPSGFVIAVNCLWFASLSASLGASFGAIICKEWLSEYDGGANPVIDLLRACQRQVRFKAFRRWKVHTLIALLPPLLHSSVLLFFSGAVIYLWQTDVRVAIVYLIIGGIFGITYFVSTLLPFVMDAPFRPYSTLLVHRFSVAIGKVIIPIVDVFVHGCFLALRYVTGAILWPLAKTIFGRVALDTWYLKTPTLLPAEYTPLRVWWADAFSDSLGGIDTSLRIQEEAILWLSQMPLDPSQSKDVVSSLALISRPHKFPKSVVVFLNFTLDSWFREAPNQRQPNVAINCILALGHIKYQSVVDRNSDRDYDVGGILVTPSVAWAAQRLTADTPDENFHTPHPEGIRARLLAAAAWLSPEHATEGVTSEGEKLKIEDRWGFLKKIETILPQHIGRGRPCDNVILIDLIHGMHAGLPRGNYGSASSIVHFLSFICEDYGSPWSGDESVLEALITYALDLLLPLERRRPLVEREIGFGKLASELIDALKVNVTYTDVVVFVFWLIYRVPYAFRLRKPLLADIVHIRALAIREDNRAVPDSDHRKIPEDQCKWINFLAVTAFVAAAQCCVVAKDTLPKLATRNTLDLLRAASDDVYGRLMATYAVAMILNLDSSSQAATFAREVDAGLFTDALYAVRSDLEGNALEESVLSLHIYSTLVLLKLHQPQVDIERVKELIREMDPGLVRMSADLHRGRWKAIYLSCLLFKFLPPGERDGPMEILRERVRTLLQSRELLHAVDYERCIEPLGGDVLELVTSPEGEETSAGPPYRAFEKWANDFPLLHLPGSLLNEK